MAFAVRNLSVLGYVSTGFTHWHYKGGTDLLDTVSAPNFFANTSDMIAVGDMILISASDGGRMVFVRQSGADGVVVEALK